ncbi:la-related protein 7-like [Planoprotostelium fungivorum]|uniref:La-related protein 7-like n=1 Tax=Planoprotostelium fungivorum TaxID=1890364 RepID=A0A2P6N6R2_9EUKA|nr:la-related protein 7-like [Planoprotostelium fungivorum]
MQSDLFKVFAIERQCSTWAGYGHTPYTTASSDTRLPSSQRLSKGLVRQTVSTRPSTPARINHVRILAAHHAPVVDLTNGSSTVIPHRQIRDNSTFVSFLSCEMPKDIVSPYSSSRERSDPFSMQFDYQPEKTNHMVSDVALYAQSCTLPIWTSSLSVFLSGRSSLTDRKSESNRRESEQPWAEYAPVEAKQPSLWSHSIPSENYTDGMQNTRVCSGIKILPRREDAEDVPCLLQSVLILTCLWKIRGIRELSRGLIFSGFPFVGLVPSFPSPSVRPSIDKRGSLYNTNISSSPISNITRYDSMDLNSLTQGVKGLLWGNNGDQSSSVTASLSTQTSVEVSNTFEVKSPSAESTSSSSNTTASNEDGTAKPKRNRQRRPSEKKKEAGKVQNAESSTSSPSDPNSATPSTTTSNETNNAEPNNVRKQLLAQLEYYFSDENLARDKFLEKEFEKDENGQGYIPVELLATFQRVKRFTATIDDIKAAIRESTFLKLNKSGDKVRRINPYIYPLSEEQRERRTIYICYLPKHSTQESVRGIFGICGTIKRVDIPVDKKSGEIKGIAFVEFESRKQARRAIAYFSDRNNDFFKLGMRVRQYTNKSGSQLTSPETTPNHSSPAATSPQHRYLQQQYQQNTSSQTPSNALQGLAIQDLSSIIGHQDEPSPRREPTRMSPPHTPTHPSNSQPQNGAQPDATNSIYETVPTFNYYQDKRGERKKRGASKPEEAQTIVTERPRLNLRPRAGTTGSEPKEGVQPIRQPKGPDGTRGFPMGRGKPVGHICEGSNECSGGFGQATGGHKKLADRGMMHRGLLFLLGVLFVIGYDATSSDPPLFSGVLSLSSSTNNRITSDNSSSSLISPNREWKLEVTTTDGPRVVHYSSPNYARWTLNQTYQSKLSPSYYISIKSGNFVFGNSTIPLWSQSPSVQSVMKTSLTLGDDGVLHLYSGSSSPFWNSTMMFSVEPFVNGTTPPWSTDGGYVLVNKSNPGTYASDVIVLSDYYIAFFKPPGYGVANIFLSYSDGTYNHLPLPYPSPNITSAIILSASSILYVEGTNAGPTVDRSQNSTLCWSLQGDTNTMCQIVGGANFAANFTLPTDLASSNITVQVYWKQYPKVTFTTYVAYVSPWNGLDILREGASVSQIFGTMEGIVDLRLKSKDSLDYTSKNGISLHAAVISNNTNATEGKLNDAKFTIPRSIIDELDAINITSRKTFLFSRIPFNPFTIDANWTVTYDVIGLSLYNNGTYSNVTDTLHPISVTFYNAKPNTTCVYWEEREKGWSPRGCETLKEDAGVTCLCSHLTNFTLATMMNVADVEGEVKGEGLNRMALLGILGVIPVILLVLIVVFFIKRHQKKSYTPMELNSSSTDIEIVREIGRGTRCTVYEAKRAGTTVVVVKKANDPQASESLSSEANRLKCMRKTLDGDTIQNIMRDIAAGLNYLHENEIVHGRLCPRKVYLTSSLHGKISAYGSDENARITADMEGYIAPEMKTDPKPTIEGDIYAYGVLFDRLKKRRKDTGEEPDVWMDIIGACTMQRKEKRWRMMQVGVKLGGGRLQGKIYNETDENIYNG